MRAKRIKDKDGKEIVIAKDGRTMNPNSLKNWDMNKPTTGFDEHPQNINRNGAPRNPIIVVKEKLTEILEKEYWGVNENNEKTVMLMLKDAVDQYFNCTDTIQKREWFKLLIGSIDSQKSDQQHNSNSIIAQNVILLPPKQDTPAQDQPNPDLEIDSHYKE